EREPSVRGVILDVLDRSEPAPGSASHLRWQLNRAIQQLQLADSTAGDTAPALDVLRSLAATPIGSEVEQALAQTVQYERLLPRTREIVDRARRVARQFPSGVPSVAATMFGTRSPAWNAAIALSVAAIAVTITATTTSALKSRPSVRADAALTLRYVQAGAGQPGTLVYAAANQPLGASSRTGRLFRDSALFGPPIAIPPNGQTAVYQLTADDRGHYYQLGAPLARGDLAVSGPVWV